MASQDTWAVLTTPDRADAPREMTSARPLLLGYYCQQDDETTVEGFNSQSRHTRSWATFDA